MKVKAKRMDDGRYKLIAGERGNKTSCFIRRAESNRQRWEFDGPNPPVEGKFKTKAQAKAAWANHLTGFDAEVDELRTSLAPKRERLNDDRPVKPSRDGWTYVTDGDSVWRLRCPGVEVEYLSRAQEWTWTESDWAKQDIGRLINLLLDREAKVAGRERVLDLLRQFARTTGRQDVDVEGII